MNSNNLKINRMGDLCYITFPRLEACKAVRHTFSTRLGGVSSGQFATMNTSFLGGDDFCAVEENYRRLCGAVGIEISHLLLSRQTHTNNVISVTKEHCGIGFNKPPFCDVDGLITNTPGVALVTQYADCTPLLFCDPINKVIATSHAGWRGTAKLIGKVTVEKMVDEFGSKAENIIVGIGPCIAKCCYEVDDTVFEEFSHIEFLNTQTIFTKKTNGKYMLDLVEANKQILLSSGVRENNIDTSDICTCCNKEDLHSHRATAGKRGNLAAIIELI